MSASTSALGRRLVIGTLVLGAAALVYRLPPVQRRLVHARIESRWDDFSGCMIGPPLGAEPLRARLRAIALTGMNAQGERAIEPHWQRHCSEPARKLKATLDQQGLGKSPLARDMEGIVTTLENGTVPEFLARGGWLEHTWASAASMGLVASTPAEHPYPRASPLRLASTPLLLDARWKPSLDPYDAVNGQRAGITLAQHRLGAYCSFDPKDGAAFGQARCWRSPPGAAPLGIKPMSSGREDARPLLFEDIRDGLFEVERGKRLMDVERASTGLSREDGFAVAATRGDKKLIVRRRINGNVERAEIEATPKALLMVGQDILWSSADDRVLRALLVADSAEPLGAPIALGEAPEGGLMGCVAAGTQAVAVGGKASSIVAFRTANGFTAPFPVGHSVGELVCEGGAQKGATVTALEADALHRTHCTFDGCAEPESLALTRLSLTKTAVVDGEVPKQITATELAGRTLVVWNAGYHGGIRMRIGALDALATTPDVVLLDDESVVIYRLALLGGGPAAVLIVEASDGAHAVRIGADGSFAALSSTLPPGR